MDPSEATAGRLVAVRSVRPWRTRRDTLGAVIVAIVRFPLSPSMSADDVRASFQSSAPSYQNLPGLMRKHYLRAEDGSVGGGVYLWESKAAAEAVYDDAWRQRLTERFGTPPTVEYFESPVMVEPDRITVE
jgi:hypothetical protein